MSETTQRKPPTNKNIKKLRTISRVCSLTRSWQRLVSENEDKQASEPSGWAPSWAGGPTKEPKKTWVPKAAPSTKEALPDQNPPAGDSQTHIADSGETQKSSTHPEETQDAPQTEVKIKTSVLPLAEPCIKTKQVVKTVTSGAQEKSAGIGFLTERITGEVPPSGEEIDKMLSKQSSPMRRRKSSNMVSSLTKSWKEVEEEKKGGSGQERSCGAEDSWYPEAENKSLETDGGQTQRTASEEAEHKVSSEGNAESAKIKRPSVPKYKKESEDANKINALAKNYSAVGNLKSRWQTWASEHTVNQKLNPFSEEFDYEFSMSTRLHRGQDGYGRPKEGTKTAERAKRAEQHIHREIDDMCYVIRIMADPDPDGKTRVTFGQLFDRYVRISDKVVGILMRARKHGKVAFEGEMLWQGQDDAVIITLLV
ncbi:actin binding Rho activating protein b [Diretmus argenteus]